MLMMLGIFVLSALFYYRNEERSMLIAQKERMIDYAAEQVRRLKRLHEAFPRRNRYPRDPRFRSAIYDLEYVQIFSTLRDNRVDFLRDIYRTGGYIHFVKLLDSYYLGAKYLFIEVPEDHQWWTRTLSRILIAGLVSGVFLTLLGIYLARLFVRPMRRSIELLDDFIQDTTHEINTPVHTILGNVEMIDPRNLSDRDRRRFERIAVAARSISTLYEDLKFLTLEQDRPLQEERIDLAQLLEERLEYFEILFRTKALRLHRDLVPTVLRADRRLMARLIDNLLSNAVKYNRRGGRIEVRLRPGVLEIVDTGVGMSPEEIEEIFERYHRFNDTEGGFGLGLDIVRRIAERYGMRIEVQSRKGEGTTMRIFFDAAETERRA